MMRLTIGRKVLLANVVMATVLVGGSAWVYFMVVRMDRLVSEAAAAQEQVVNIGVISESVEMIRRSRGTLIALQQSDQSSSDGAGTAGLRERIRENTIRRDTLMSAVSRSSFSDSASIEPYVAALRSAVDEFDDFFRQLEAMNRAGQYDLAARVAERNSPALERKLADALGNLRTHVRMEAGAFVDRSESYRRRLFLRISLVLGGTVGFMILTQVLLSRSVRSSTRQLDSAMRAVAEGDLQYRVDVESRDEFGELGDGFNAMSQRLAELDELKADFLSNVSHELRTPIASVKQSAEILRDELLGPLSEEQKEIVDIVSANAKRLGALINDLLDTAKLEAGSIELSLAETDLPALVRSVVKSVSPLASEKNLTITMNVEENLAPVMADPLRMEQVLANLLSNAVKFTPEGGEIRVRCRSEGGMALCDVEDTGVGIPDEELPYVFDKFHQVRATKTRKTKGTGLGLTIVRYLIEAHGGYIRVASTVDVGTTFTFAVPMARRDG